MQFFGVLFLITTTLVLIFKKEKQCNPSESLEDSLTLVQTYKLVWKILKLKSVKELCLLLITFKVVYNNPSVFHNTVNNDIFLITFRLLFRYRE